MIDQQQDRPVTGVANRLAELLDVGDRLAVDFLDDVAALHIGVGSLAVRIHIGDHDAADTVRQIELLPDVGSEVADLQAFEAGFGRRRRAVAPVVAGGFDVVRQFHQRGAHLFLLRRRE